MNAINVAIADDHALFREGIRLIISHMPGITLTVEASGGDDLLQQLQQAPADVVLLDIEMKNGGGIETLKKINKLAFRPKVLILSMHLDSRMTTYMMESGADGCIQKDIQKTELETAIRRVYETGIYLNSALTSFLISGMKNKNRRNAPVVDLSRREKEVLALICHEHTNQEIGKKLFISERTVEGHRKNLCEKLGVKNTAGLVRKTVELRLIDLS